MIAGLVLMALSYFIGCISPATILAKSRGIDIRKEGSGNPGTTNVLRTMGRKYAVICLICDVLKGVICVLLGMLVSRQFAYGCGVMVIIGHCWPFEFRFRGGKGIATCIGVITVINPLLALILLASFAIVVALTRYVSLGSIIAALIFPAMSLWLEPGYFWFALVMTVIVVFKHRANIVRLIHGEEPKISLGGKK